MICMVLAAGYATRLYPLTENFPKPLLKVGDKTILDWLLDDIDEAANQSDIACSCHGIVTKYVIISNHKYVSCFEQWADSKRLSAPIVVLDDGSTANDNRLGAVMDIQFALEKLACGAKKECGDISACDDDVLVIAGDNVLDFSLSSIIRFSLDKARDAALSHADAPVCVMRYSERSIAKLQKTGVAEVDGADRITRMEEKPAEPFSHWCIPPFYFYPSGALHYVRDAIVEGCNTDAPGSFIAWLASKTNVYAMLMPGKRYDIGDYESYHSVRDTYTNIKA